MLIGRTVNGSADRCRKQISGNQAIAAFVVSLIAYTLQTEAAQYVQAGLGYRKPFLSLYLGHSGFILLLPLHILFLRWHTGLPWSHWTHLIAQNLHWQLSTPTRQVNKGHVQQDIRRRLSIAIHRDEARPIEPYEDLADEEEATVPASPARPRPQRAQSWRESVRMSSLMPFPTYRGWSENYFGFNAVKLALLLLVLMTAITIPALSWYSAVPMTSMADITALYNTFSVWALVFSVWFLGDKWSRYKVASVLLACGGVIIVAYGGAEHRRKPKDLDPIYGKPTSTSSLAASSTMTASATSMTSSLTPSSDATSTITNAASAPSVMQTAIDMAVTSAFQAIDRALGSSATAPWGARGGGDLTGEPKEDPSSSSASNPLLGDLLALFGAITMAAYEMAFKLLGTLPDEEAQNRHYDPAAPLGSRVRGSRSDRPNRLGVRRTRVDMGDDDGEGLDDRSRTEQGLLLGDGAEDDQDDDKDGLGGGRHVLGDDDDDEGHTVGEGRKVSESRSSCKRQGGRLSAPSPHDELTAFWNGDSSPGYGSHGNASPRVDGNTRPQEVNGTVDAGLLSDRMSRIDAGTDGYNGNGKSTEKGQSDDSPRVSVTVRPAPSIRDGESRRGRTEDEDDDDDVDDDNDLEDLSSDPVGVWIPPPLPFGMHANIMTAGIGAATASTLWLGVVSL